MPGLDYTSIDTFDSPIGTLYLLFTGDALSGIEFCLPEHIPDICTLPVKLSETCRSQMDKYFKGSLRTFQQRIIFIYGTAFEKIVWECIKDIPYGETRTYKWVAETIGRPKAVRAVGQALGKNPLPVIVPCHRVIASDGSLGGFSSGTGASGITIKKWLLRHERISQESPKRAWRILSY